MDEMKARYINPFTDFGFKKIFGEEANKNFLIDFLNALLPEKHKITELTFKNTESLGNTSMERKAIYDIYCENEHGEKFIVELQKSNHKFFKDRTVYYSTFPIQELAEQGHWGYELKAVYCICILDFTFDDHDTEPEKSEVIHTVVLKNQNNKVFYDKLTLIYLEMPNFKKTENEIHTRLDQWLYFIKHLEDCQQIPTLFKDDVFVQAFEKAELSNLNPEELKVYQYHQKVYRDYYSAMYTAYLEGNEKGMEEGRMEGEKSAKINIALSMIHRGMSLQEVLDITGLSEQDIRPYK